MTVNAYLEIFISTLSITFPLTFKGTWYNFQRWPWRCYDWPESLPTLPPRGWKSSPSQLVVVRWPDHYKKKLLEALEKHLLSWQEPMTSALPSPFLPFLMHMDCPGLVGHFIISEGKRQTAETHPDILERMVNTNHYPYPNFIKCGKQLPGWVFFFFCHALCLTGSWVSLMA